MVRGLFGRTAHVVRPRACVRRIGAGKRRRKILARPIFVLKVLPRRGEEDRVQIQTRAASETTRCPRGTTDDALCRRRVQRDRIGNGTRVLTVTRRRTYVRASCRRNRRSVTRADRAPHDSPHVCMTRRVCVTVKFRYRNVRIIRRERNDRFAGQPIELFFRHERLLRIPECDFGSFRVFYCRRDETFD